jgi:hypothetical protein
MKKTGKAMALALLLIVLAGVGELSYPDVGIQHPFDVTLEPSAPLKKNAPVTMSLTFEPISKYPCGNSGSVAVTTMTYPYRDTLGDTTWLIQFEDGQPYSTTFQITVPDNDTTMLRVTLGCGWLRDPITRYFITTGDTVQCLNGFRRENRKNGSSSNTNDPLRDTLTEEQLQTEYDVILNLHDSAHLKIAEKILGPIPDSCLYDRHRGYYRLMVSLKNLIKLADEKVGFEYATPPPWDHRHRTPEDNVLPPPPPPSPQTDEIDVDTLTPEQLQSELEVMLWFRDSTERKATEEIVGPLPDSAKLPGPWGAYRLKMSLEKFLEIRKHNVDAHLLKPREHINQTPKDSVPQPIPQDSLKPQGALDELHEGAYQLGWILLDHVDGLTAMGELARNQPITFYLVVVNWWYTLDGLTNGFRIYSPDGAQWTTTSADTLPIGWEEMFDTTFGIYSYSANGMGADTVAYFAIGSYCGKSRDRQMTASHP